MSIILAFSGGLDTSFCVPFLSETLNTDVITVTVNTGGFTADELISIQEKSATLGAAHHVTVDAREQLFTDHVAYLIKGNMMRGGTYPICVGPERVVQAQELVKQARLFGADTLAHGSTGAGNDQVRFDVALSVLAGDLKLLAPIREHSIDRAFASEFLTSRGFPVAEKTTSYSVNTGLWGTTIGGKETHSTHLPLPESAFVNTVAPAAAPDAGVECMIGFEHGIPVALDGLAMSPVALIEQLALLGNQHGIGRGMHVGDTILGIKGRVGFEAPAAMLLINAHRELEKIVLGKWQRYQKDQMSEFYAMLLHEGQYFDPVMKDIRAMIDSSQQRVTGTVNVQMRQGVVSILGCSSPWSMFDTAVASYGETNTLWDGRDADGFTKIAGVPSRLAASAGVTA